MENCFFFFWQNRFVSTDDVGDDFVSFSTPKIIDGQMCFIRFRSSLNEQAM